MDVKDRGKKAKHGFALIVVLSGLAVLTSLFAVTSSRTLAHLQTNRSNANLAESMHDDSEILRLVLDTASDGLDRANQIQTSLNGIDVSIDLIDVGGLIDLNTASPELLGMLVAQMGLPSEALTAYRTWRRTPYRLLRVTDFLRITGAGPEHWDWVKRVTTVHSGRRGIAPNQAPLEVLELVTGQTGARDTLAEAIPDGFISPASGTNFNVMTNMAGHTGEVLIGTIHVTNSRKQNRILWRP